MSEGWSEDGRLNGLIECAKTSTPSGYDEDDTRVKTTAEHMADSIILITLNDRKGYHIDTLNKELQKEIRDEVVAIIEKVLALHAGPLVQ